MELESLKTRLDNALSDIKELKATLKLMQKKLNFSSLTSTLQTNVEATPHISTLHGSLEEYSQTSSCHGIAYVGSRHYSYMR